MQKKLGDVPDFKQGESEFWMSISPDVRSILQNMEKSESWVYNDSDFPELFEEMSLILLKMISIDSESDNENIEDILDDIIIILSVIPFRQCMYALSWLENYSLSNYGWGIKIKSQCEENISENMYQPGSTLYNCSHVINERIRVLVILNTIQQVFSSPMKKIKNEVL